MPSLSADFVSKCLFVSALSLASVYLYMRVPDSAVEQTVESKPVATETIEAVATEPKPPVDAPTELEGVVKTEKGHDFDELMKRRLAQVADAYEKDIEHPSYSRPIREGELNAKYVPQPKVESLLPLNPRDPESPQVAITPNKTRLFAGDQLIISASIRGLGEDAMSEVRATLNDDSTILDNALVDSLGDEGNESSAREYELRFPSLSFGDETSYKELTARIDVNVNGTSYRRMVKIEYFTTIANLDDIAPASVNGSYLEIPAYVSTSLDGFHRLTANLYDAKSGEALVHLRAEDEIASGHGTLIFKAHIGALKQSGSSGPYELKDMMLKRLPTYPDMKSGYGLVSQEAYQVDGFPFEDYTDKPYVNENTQLIAKELRRMAQ